jgi:hypothetical protein
MNHFNPKIKGISPSVNLTNVFTTVTNQEVVRVNDIINHTGGDNGNDKKEEIDN